MHVLIVEDDDAIRESIVEVLIFAGHSVDAVANGMEALSHLKSKHRKPDLILLDLMMPVMDGWTFMDETSRIADFLSIPIVVISAVVSECRLNAHPSLRGIIQKPIKLDQFLSLVQEIADSTVRARLLSELN